MTVATELMARWQSLTEEARWPPEDAAAVGAELIDRYDEPHRHYHTTIHLISVLRVLDELAGPDLPPLTARLAAWFHDAVYAGAPGSDEEASAQLAEARLLELGTPLADASTVAAMVRATAGHTVDGATPDELTAMVLDADLSILGADLATYGRYCDAIRAEYAHVPDDRFVAGRLALVESLLARDRLFITGAGRARFEHAAHRNLARERDRLRAASS